MIFQVQRETKSSYNNEEWNCFDVFLKQNLKMAYMMSFDRIK